MDEHDALGVEAHQVRSAIAASDPATAHALLKTLTGHLDRHVLREEDGIFRAMRATGDFLDEVDALEGEHRDLDAAVAALDPAAPDFASSVTRLLKDLAQHIDREDLGIFPVSVVTLGATEWALVDLAHERSPSFLTDPETATPATDRASDRASGRQKAGDPCRRRH